jgi:membrane protease YdiL (CAAX protease family)
MQDFIVLVVLFLPLLLILWLANYADRQRAAAKAALAPASQWDGQELVTVTPPSAPAQSDSSQVLAIISYALLVLLYLFLIAGGVVAQVAGAMLHGTLPPELAQSYRQMGVDPASIATALPKIGLALWLPSIFGIILLLRPVRNLLARIIPIDPGRTVHAIALSYTMLVIINLLFTVGFGLGTLAQLAQSQSAAGTPNTTILNTWGQELLFLFLAMVGVGLLSRRNLGATLQRLGIVVPKLSQVGIAFGIAVVLVPAVLVLEYLATRIGFGPSQEVQKLSDQLIGPLGRTLPGVLTLGLAAALGEESLLRGALQPRFGLLLTAIIFALLHSTYGLSLSTLLVFLVGLVLGVVRMRANTSTSMVVHATYNCALGLITYLGLMQNF